MRLLIFILFFTVTANGQYTSIVTIAGAKKKVDYTRHVTTLNSNLLPDSGTLIINHGAALSWNANQVVEPSFFYDNATSDIKIYYTGSYDSTAPSFNNRLGLTTTTDMVSFTANAGNPLIGQGHGGAPSGRRVNSSWVGKIGSTYYCLAANGYGYNYSGEDRNIYGYTSTDGITWTDQGLKVNKNTAWAGGTVNGFANTGVVTDQYNTPVVINGKYVALVEAGTSAGYWETFRMEADSLMGTWTITQKVKSLQPVTGAMYGGPQCIYYNGTYYAFIHYGTTVGNLPTYLAYATSSDCMTWTRKEVPFMTINADPYPNTDQIADMFFCEINGKVYMMAEYVQNSPTYQGQIRLWTYNGTFADLINTIQ